MGVRQFVEVGRHLREQGQTSVAQNLKLHVLGLKVC